MNEDILLSPNNIRISNHEVNFLSNYLRLSKDKLLEKIILKELSFYLHINTNSYTLNLSDPPHITYELYIMIKIDGKYYLQVFTKCKFPLEFEELNKIQEYIPLFPYEYISGYDLVEYPIMKKCHKMNIYTNKQVRVLKTLLKKISVYIPDDIIEEILSYIILKSFDIDNSNFFLTSDFILGNNILIENFFSISDRKIGVAIKV